MAKKSASDPRAFALETLAESIADSSEKVLFGSSRKPGFFKGTNAKTKAAAEYCVQQGWLEDTGEKDGKGARAKSLYRITPLGIQAVLEYSSPVGVLEALSNAVNQQQDQLENISRDVIALQQQTSQKIEALDARMGRVKEMAERTIENIKPPDVAALLASQKNSQTNGNDTARNEKEAREQAILERLANTDPFNQVKLSDLYDELELLFPNLSVGAFHDTLRNLFEQQRITFSPYTRSYTEIAGDRAALYLDGEVMYYVRRN